VIGVLEKAALRLTKLNRIAMISPMVQDVLTEEGFCQDRIAVVGNGVNVEDYPFSVNKIPHGLIYIGRLTELKRAVPFLSLSL